MNPIQSKQNRRRGSVAVEAALIIPFVVALALGAIDVAQYINTSQLVTNASREGARFASRYTTTSVQEVETAIDDFFGDSFPNLDTNTLQNAITLTVLNGDGSAVTNGDLSAIPSGEELSVQVDFDFTVIRWFNGPALMNNNVNQSLTVFRRE